MSFLFTVVIPSYNRTDSLRRALRSVQNQSFQDFDIVISDDCSPTPAADVIGDLVDDRITIVRGDRNLGNAGARNAGVRQATGKWIAFLDDDDEMFSHHLESTHAILEGAPESVGFCWSGIERVQEDDHGEIVVANKSLWSPSFLTREDAYLSFLRERKIGTGMGLTVRRDAFVNDVGYFDERLRAAVDADFLIRIAQAKDFRVVNDHTVRVRDHLGPRVSLTKKNKAEAYEIIVEKHKEFLVEHPDIYAIWLYKIACFYYYSSERQKGRAAALKLLKLRPLWHKTWACLGLFEGMRGLGTRLHRHLTASR